ncbi:IclR family transcriptional regulator [Nitriliruptoraceae bacterium ZYF776]|nr:IclR family transcriptional regulator [Profundirhabdus halotolerans]
MDETIETATFDGGFRPVKSAGRVLEVLEELAAHGPRSMRELADHLDVPRSSMHALLRTMQHYGWLETDATGTLYGLGVHSLLVGSAYVDRDDVVARTAPVLDTLAEKTGETVHLGRLEGDHIVYLAKRESAHPLRMFSSVGRRLSAFSTALGKCLLAGLDDDEIERRMPADLVAATPKTLTDPDELLADIRRVRTRGYAIDDEESALGLRCFAIALPPRAPTQDAISISVPVFRLDEDRESEFVRLLFEARYSIAS